MKKILIIEDEVIIAKDLQIILEEAGFSVCGILNGTENVPEEIKKCTPDIIISDIYLKGKLSGIDIMKEVQRHNPKPLIFITAYSSNDIIEELSQIRHDGYIVKPFTDKQVVATTKLVASRYVDHNCYLDLTEREKEIAILIINGMNNNEIACQLNISLYTVTTHRKNIYKKLSVSTVSQLIIKLSFLVF